VKGQVNQSLDQLGIVEAQNFRVSAPAYRASDALDQYANGRLSDG